MEPKFNIDPKLIEELAKSVKTEKDLAALSKHLLKTLFHELIVHLPEELIFVVRPRIYYLAEYYPFFHTHVIK